MLAESNAFSSFAVPDIDEANKFYSETLGLKTSVLQDGNLITLHLAGDRDTMIYVKPDFTPATYTVLNFEVEADDVEKVVDELASHGVSFEHYEGFEQDEKGIFIGEGPRIAWFKDPAGNILSVVEPQ